MNEPQTPFFNRELSWLEFNQRVLDEARDPDLPLLERLKFLAISASNLDEFFMVRVGGLRILKGQGSQKPDPAGLTPEQQLDAIAARTGRMVADQYACFRDDLEPKLASEGIRRAAPGTLTERQSTLITRIFDEEIYPVFTPMAVEPGNHFPILVNQTLNLCVRLAPAAGTAEARFAVIPLGRSPKRFLTVQSEGGYAYMLLEDAVAMLASRFFSGETVEECVAFRITRNADLAIREDQASDLLAEMEEVLDARKESACVRLEIAEPASDDLRGFLRRCLDIADDSEIVRVPGPIDLAAMMRVAELPGFDRLKYEPWPPKPSPLVDLRGGVFDAIARRDVLLHHPYESFEPVVRLIEEAADDPDVLAIKQTLYRTGRDSPIVAALCRASEKGKHVTAIVELKARFDEERNIEGARNLEQASVQVIYGVKGLKTHAKLCIIVRREPHGIQRYVHFGTGNYNEVTARIYSDISYMTTDEELGADATSFFNAISGYSQPQQFRKIEAAPLGLRDTLLEMIGIETQRRRQGQRARIAAKLNSLVDPPIIEALYAASQAGVTVQLNVRGICCLRPGVKGLSDNISVVSIVDRFLEHSRIVYFHHGGDERVFISSADWMPRNLDRRIELLVPIDDASSRQRLIAVLDTYFRDNTKARRLTPDGSYERIRARGRRRAVRCQQTLYEEARDAMKRAEHSRRTTFEPYRAHGSGG
ncbi:MAG: polyphosphate kinase 1 [Planctomycetes bacterium]|nr:polyphosphate kinase 1 [Planctomycetota bacterium]